MLWWTYTHTTKQTLFNNQKFFIFVKKSRTRCVFFTHTHTYIQKSIEPYSEMNNIRTNKQKTFPFVLDCVIHVVRNVGLFGPLVFFNEFDRQKCKTCMILTDFHWEKKRVSFPPKKWNSIYHIIIGLSLETNKQTKNGQITGPEKWGKTIHEIWRRKCLSFLFR